MNNESSISMRAYLIRECLRKICTSFERDGGITSFYGIDINKFSVFVPPQGYVNRKFNLDGLKIDMLIDCKSKNSEKIIYQLHGGAYVYNMNDLYRIQALRLSKISKGATVVTIDYRVAPANTYPAALTDAVNGWNWLISQGYKPQNIIVTGDSAGGNLALALCLYLRAKNKEMPKALVLMSPWADLSEEGESFKTNVYNDPMFGLKKGKQRKDGFHAISTVYAGNFDTHEPMISPVYADYNNFCPMLIQCGSEEVLQSCCKTIAEKTADCKNNVKFTQYDGMWHMFQLFGNLFPESAKAWNEAENFICETFINKK